MTNEAILERLIGDGGLDREFVTLVIERMLSGAMPASQMAACLVLLRTKNGMALQIASIAPIVLEKAVAIAQPSYMFADVVGTGGDGHHTINVSTLSSLTAASLGLPVAKHGSSSVSSSCGAADLLKELGVDVALTPEKARECLDVHRWCFLFAPLYHVAFKAVKELRSELRVKTIFNILGPLTNPMRPPVMLIGVYQPELIMPFTMALKDLGQKRALVVHGSGLDEIALHGPTMAALLDNGDIQHHTFSAKDFGLTEHRLEDIKGGSPKDNAKLCREILSGTGDEAKIDMVAATTGALLWLAEKATSLKHGATMAKSALHAGEPMRTLENIKGFF